MFGLLASETPFVITQVSSAAICRTEVAWSRIVHRLPSGLKAYIVTESSVDANEATLKGVNNLLPATAPVVIKAEQAGTYLLTPYDGDVAPLDKWENELIGTFIGQEGKWGVSVNQDDANQGSILTLGRNSQGEVGFFYLLINNPKSWRGITDSSPILCIFAESFMQTMEKKIQVIK
jgi:hypothetical protein